MAGVDLAEAYVLRKLHKEKMKEAEEGGRNKKSMIGSKAKSSSGCFFWLCKKHRRTKRVKDNNEKELIAVLDPINKNHMACRDNVT